MGRIYFYQKKNDLALSEAKKALELYPNKSYNHLLLGDIYSHNIHRAENCWDNQVITQGINAYRDAIRLAANNVDAHLGLSYLYIHRGAYNLAVVESKIAVRLSDSARNHKQLGYALLHAGDYEGAIEEYGEALKRNPRYPAARQSLAFAYFLGRELRPRPLPSCRLNRLVCKRGYTDTHCGGKRPSNCF